jgi:hypothetical protein
VLRRVYFDNARRLLVRSWPLPTVRAVRIGKDFKPDGRLHERAWAGAPTARIEYGSKDGDANPELATTARFLWTERHLYAGFEGRYGRLTTFGKAAGGSERLGLWERDVVEVFLGTDPNRAHRYAEFEVAPTGERLDVAVDLPAKDFGWASGFEAASRVDGRRGVWTVEMRVRLDRLGAVRPRVGERWRLNLYRHDAASGRFLAWSPTATGSAHTPERFGYLEFGD